MPTGASYGKVKKGKKMGTDDGVCPYLLIRGNGEYVITKYVYMAFCLKALFAVMFLLVEIPLIKEFLFVSFPLLAFAIISIAF